MYWIRVLYNRHDHFNEKSLKFLELGVPPKMLFFIRDGLKKKNIIYIIFPQLNAIQPSNHIFMDIIAS